MSSTSKTQYAPEYGSFNTDIVTFLPRDASSDAYRDQVFMNGVYPYPQRIGYEDYTRQKYQLQVALTELQRWVRQSGERILIIFEGRDTAGKSATIKRFMEHMNPKVTRVVALDKPTDIERGQWYFQRYIEHLPTAGEVVFFDRSWYNRAGVERVMNFATEPQIEQFFDQVVQVENLLVSEGIRLFKFYLSVGQSEQHSRVSGRLTQPLDNWKLSPIDLRANELWGEYSEAKIEMFRRTDTETAPWTIIKSDDKMRARLNAMRHVLNATPYSPKSIDIDLVPDPALVAPVCDFISSELRLNII
jgi:polyphosphate kinase 2